MNNPYKYDAIRHAITCADGTLVATLDSGVTAPTAFQLLDRLNYEDFDALKEELEKTERTVERLNDVIDRLHDRTEELEDEVHLSEEDAVRHQARAMALEEELATLKAQPQPAAASSHWDEDPEHPVNDWKYEVANDDTRQGYPAWVESQREWKKQDTQP